MLLLNLQPASSLFPYTTLFRSTDEVRRAGRAPDVGRRRREERATIWPRGSLLPPAATKDRKSTRLNSSHQIISYAVFCLKKKNMNNYCAKNMHRPKKIGRFFKS